MELVVSGGSIVGRKSRQGRGDGMEEMVYIGL